MKIKAFLRKMVESARPAFNRFWVPTLFSWTMTGVLVASTYDRFPGAEPKQRLSLALLSGLLTSLCAVLFWERRGIHKTWVSRRGGNLVALPVAAFVTIATYTMLKDLTLQPLSRHVAFCVFLFLTFLIIPNMGRGRNIEMYSIKLFTNAVVAALFSGVLFLGLSFIILTVSTLFGLNIPSLTYLRLWILMAGAVAPFLFMAGIPETGWKPEEERYPALLKNLVLFVITPLAAAYTAILYLYFAKILVTRQWPVGLVSHLVLWYSLLGVALLFFLWPLSQNPWGAAFSKHFPMTVIPLLGMMFVSVGIRIRHYGITENRYYVAALGLWVLGSMLYLSLSKNVKSVALPASLAFVVLLSVLGPWSSFASAKLSQNLRLEGLLGKYGMLEKGAIIPTANAEEIPTGDRREFAQILFYFDRNHSLEDVKYLPDGFSMTKFQDVFGFSYTESPLVEDYFCYVVTPWSLDTGGYRYLFDFTRPFSGESNVTSLAQGGIGVTYDRSKFLLSVTLDGNPQWTQSLNDMTQELFSKCGPGQFNLDPQEMTFTGKGTDLDMKVIITEVLAAQRSDAEGIATRQISFLLLVRNAP